MFAHWELTEMVKLVPALEDKKRTNFPAVQTSTVMAEIKGATNPSTQWHTASKHHTTRCHLQRIRRVPITLTQPFCTRLEKACDKKILVIVLPALTNHELPLTPNAQLGLQFQMAQQMTGYSNVTEKTPRGEAAQVRYSLH